MISTSNVTIPTPPSLQGFNANHNTNCRYNRDIHVKAAIRSKDCDWACRLPEVQRACTLAHVCLTNKPKYCRIKTDIKAIIQSGPTCGLTGMRPRWFFAFVTDCGLKSIWANEYILETN